MPVCKAEAHRALELLEDYYARLDDSDEKELKAAIERVIKIFKSRLFQVYITCDKLVRFACLLRLCQRLSANSSQNDATVQNY